VVIDQRNQPKRNYKRCST